MNASLAITLLLGLLDRAHAIGELINKAKAEGRDITDAEIDQLATGDDAARLALASEIAKARAG